MAKKAYKKPVLKKVKMLKVGATLCCRGGTGCNASARNTRMKGSTTSSTS